VNEVPDPGASTPGTTNDLAARLAAVEQQLERLSHAIACSRESASRSATDLLSARRNPSYETAYQGEPLITVRIGTFRGDDLLFDRALSSVRRQSYANWEAIVVCDGRQPSTGERIAALGDPRIRCVQRPRNGPYPAEAHARWLVAGSHPFNEAHAWAAGSWIAPIDQDDEWEDDHLESLLATAQDGRAEVAFGVARAIVPPDGETYFGAWPPSLGDFGFQTAIYHAGLTAFLYDANTDLTGEPTDWNLARRMLEAGVRFDFLDRIVTNYYVDERAASIGWWRERVATRGSFSA
jgi:glycosyltransferase involved in cell wall biosynthesis